MAATAAVTNTRAPDHFEELLRRWGRVYGEAPPTEWEEEGSGSPHPLAVAMEYAPGRLGRAVSVAYKRVTRPGERSWSRDPIPCVETRQASSALYFTGASSSQVAPELARVEAAVLALYRINTLRGLVMRGQYCRRGPQAEQVEWINGLDRGISLTLRSYRDELAHARTWVHGRLA